jgi:SAM-dependent methyltransferase
VLSQKALTDFLSNHLACPNCRHGLTREVDGWRCALCATEYHHRESYVDFLSASSPSSFKVETDFSERYEAPQTKYWRALGQSNHAYWCSLPATFAKYLARPGRGLDIGCWLGRSRPMYGDILTVLCVLDPDAHQLRGGDEGVFMARGIGEKLPFRDEAFDLLVIHATLDHCVDYRRALDESARVLAPGGVISIVLTNDRSWSKRVLPTAARKRRHAATAHHNVFLAPGILTDDLVHRGFEVLRLRGMRYLMIPERLQEAACSVLGSRMATVLRWCDAVGNAIAPTLGGDFHVIARKRA